MTTISQATINDLETIRAIAHATWPFTYGQILSKEQLMYMLEKMYSDDALKANLAQGHHFIIAKEDSIALGFASIEHNYLNKDCTRLHKIYLLPENQGNGLGKLLLERIMVLAKENHSTTISLNVNRFNKAFAFYEKMGFEVVAQEDIDIGNGYWMQDYRLEKKI